MTSMNNEHKDAATLAQRLRKLEEEYNELNKKHRSVGGYLSPQENRRRNQLQPILNELRAEQKKLVSIRKSFENNIYSR
jgi:archaellum component FlaC